MNSINDHQYCVPLSYDDPRLDELHIKINRKSKISFGKFCIGRHSRINGIMHAKHGTVKVGMFCTGGFDIKLIAGNHNYTYANMQMTLQRAIQHGARKKIKSLDAGYIDIGSNVWLGDNCMVLKDVTIGDGAVIGTSAVVTKDVPPFAIVAGVPARIIRYRFPQKIREQLLEIAWWNWPMERILEEKAFFTSPLSQSENFNAFSLLKLQE